MQLVPVVNFLAVIITSGIAVTPRIVIAGKINKRRSTRAGSKKIKNSEKD
jgi:hypothetical protein